MKQAKNLVLIIAGNTLYAAAVALFIIPNGLITGGTTGIALFINRFSGIPISGFVGAFNVLMFLMGAAVLGRKFAMTTLLSTFYYPAALAAMQYFLKDYHITEDIILSTVFAGLLIGTAIGLVIRGGASTGGMDIPPLALNKKCNIPIALSMYAFDILILFIQMLGTDKEKILYGMLLVLIYTIVLDKILVIGKNKLQVKIISREYEKINHAIQTVLDRGTTFFEVEGGYMREESYAVLTVLDNRELPKLNEIVRSIDSKAFLIVNQVAEVRGRGFTLEKRYMQEENK